MTRTPDLLTDPELLTETARAAGSERHATTELIALLAEVETRKLYLAQSHSSLFTWCTQVLHLSESAAYSRISAARTARRFPIIIEQLRDGSITLTTVTLLAAHLTDDNHAALLAAARHRSKREIEHLLACLDPQPDFAGTVRKLPEPKARCAPATTMEHLLPQSEAAAAPECERRTPSPARRTVVAPIAPARYLVKFTASQETHDKLKRATDLLRHAIPNGDPAAIVNRALTVLITELEKTKHAAVHCPRAHTSTASSRHVPAAVKRTVWARDEGRCAYVGTRGRCTETGFLEFHHVVPFAIGGATSTDNLQLRCRAHNAYEAEVYFSEHRWPEFEFGKT